MAIDRPGHTVVHHWIHFFAAHVLDRHDRFGICHVRELCGSNHVSNCVHIWLSSLAITINFNKAALADFYLGSAQTKFIGVWPATDRHHHCVNLQRVARTKRHRGATCSFWSVAGDFHVGANVDVLFLERLDHHVGHVMIKAWQHLG